MKVLLCQNVDKLGHIGDVVDVRQGYARNYLLPGGLATRPTAANIKALDADKQAYLAELAKHREDIQARAEVVDGKEVTITALANEEGHLYGSIGPTQIAAALAAEGVSVEPDNIMLDEPIHRLDKYEVQIRFADDITANVGVWVVPPGDTGEAQTDGNDQGGPPAKPEADPVSS